MGMSISRSASVAPSFVNLDTEETKEWKGIARKNITNTRVIDALEPLKRRASIGHANGDPGNMGVEVVTTMCGQMDVNNDLFWQEWADCGGQVDRCGYCPKFPAVHARGRTHTHARRIQPGVCLWVLAVGVMFCVWGQ